MKPIAVSSFIVAAALAQPAPAQPIYKCGPDGRTYSQVPCAGGRMLESSDPRTAAQRREALRVSERERAHAARLERERLAAERARKPGGAAGLGASAPASPARTPAAQKDFVATVPKQPAAPASARSR